MELPHYIVALGAQGMMALGAICLLLVVYSRFLSKNNQVLTQRVLDLKQKMKKLIQQLDDPNQVEAVIEETQKDEFEDIDDLEEPLPTPLETCINQLEDIDEAKELLLKVNQSLKNLETDNKDLSLQVESLKEIKTQLDYRIDMYQKTQKVQHQAALAETPEDQGQALSRVAKNFKKHNRYGKQRHEKLC